MVDRSFIFLVKNVSLIKLNTSNCSSNAQKISVPILHSLYALHKPHLLNGEVTVYRDIFRTWPSRRSKQPASKSQAD